MNTFFIARHGETINNRQHRLSGWVDTPMTEDGLEPIERVVAKLSDTRFDTICSSDLGRAFITAYVIARKLRFTEEIQRLAGLREVNYGDAANMFSKEAYAMYPMLDSDTHFTPLNGESLDHMQQRVFRAIEEINQKHQAANILLVAHSGVMAALHASHIGRDFGEHNISEAYAHDYVGKFTYADGQVASFEEFVG